MNTYAVLVEIGTSWPEVVFVGDYEDARLAADRVERAGLACSLQAVVSIQDTIESAV